MYKVKIRATAKGMECDFKRKVDIDKVLNIESIIPLILHDDLNEYCSSDLIKIEIDIKNENTNIT